VIGFVVGHLVYRNDADRRGDVKGLEVPVKPPSNLVKVPSVIAMTCFLSVDAQETVPAMSRAMGPRKAPLSPRARAWPEQSVGPERRKNLEHSGREEAGLPVGEIYSRNRLVAAAAVSTLQETSRGGDCRKPEKWKRLAYPEEHLNLSFDTRAITHSRRLGEDRSRFST
jgi:hypothetical protein